MPNCHNNRVYVLPRLLTLSSFVSQDTESFYKNPPPALSSFKPADLEGRWFKVLGYNPNYDLYPCQQNTFTMLGNGGVENEILFRVPKPDGSGSWQVRFSPRLPSNVHVSCSFVTRPFPFNGVMHADAWSTLCSIDRGRTSFPRPSSTAKDEAALR